MESSLGTSGQNSEALAPSKRPHDGGRPSLKWDGRSPLEVPVEAGSCYREIHVRSQRGSNYDTRRMFGRSLHWSCDQTPWSNSQSPLLERGLDQPARLCTFRR